MAKHRAVIVGAGRIGAGWNWIENEYTHAGAYRALRERVDFVAFVEPNAERATAAAKKWGVPAFTGIASALDEYEPDIISICVQPEQQREALISLCGQKQIVGIWCEKPYVCEFKKYWPPIQVNYLRRACKVHQMIARDHPGGVIKVFGKDDVHTRCHFEDLAQWWKAVLEYHPENGPCRYYYTTGDKFDDQTYAFPNGGLERPGDQMKAMLENLLDHLDKGEPLWSPPQIV